MVAGSSSVEALAGTGAMPSATLLAGAWGEVKARCILKLGGFYLKYRDLTMFWHW